MKKAIQKRRRSVRFLDGRPVVNIDGAPYTLRQIVSAGTDNPKTAKNTSNDWLAACVVLAPADSSGVANLCAFAGECVKTCLDHQGKGAAPGDLGRMIHAPRIARSVVFTRANRWFMRQFAHELTHTWLPKAQKQNKRLCMRGNMLSDVPWENTGIVDDFPTVQWYDYTKNPNRVGWIRPNYYVTFSRDTSKDDQLCKRLLSEGKNVAIAYDDGRTSGGRNLHGVGCAAPKTWNGFPCIDGDITDARWQDKPGHVVMLRLKAASASERAKALASGFAIQNWDN